MNAAEIEERLRPLSVSEYAVQRSQIMQEFPSLRASDLDAIYRDVHRRREPTPLPSEAWPDEVEREADLR